MSKVIWFTGLSGSGKSTLAAAFHHFLQTLGVSSYVLDGDVLRMGLNRDLGFSEKDRQENIRRAGEVAKILKETGVIVLAAFISPFEEDRKALKERIGPDDFLEVFVNAPLKVCESRDVKGLYQKARKGLIPMFTGIDSPYEIPKNPDLILKTNQISIVESVGKLSELLKCKGVLQGNQVQSLKLNFSSLELTNS
jgi:adenylylsulfate kinase